MSARLAGAAEVRRSGRLPSVWRWLVIVGLGLGLAHTVASAQDSSSGAIDVPRWFTDSFLDFREELTDATRDGRRLMIYFGQDGCPYCKQLMATSFSQRSIVEKTRSRFVAIALNLWGDRETIWFDGRAMSEKALARRLDVQFTPTLLFFDERGGVVARLNGYYPPHRFEAVLDYVSTKREGKETLAAYVARRTRDPASSRLADEPFFLAPPYNLARGAGSKPLAVLFETTYCSPCDELHREGLQRPGVRALLKDFDVARFAFGAPTRLTTPDGRQTTAEAWATELGVTFAPTFVFFAADGREAFRIDSYLRPFHLESSLDYVASGAYRDEPSFQRFIQARAERLRASGTSVDLWK